MMTYTFVDSSLWYLQWLRKEKDFDSALDDQILTLQQELRFTRTYLIYLAMSKGIPSRSSSLINNVESAFVNATKDLSSACCRDLSQVDSVVSHMLEEVKHCKQEIWKAYAILWEEPWKSNTLLIRLSVMEFVDSVLDNLKDLLGSESLILVIRKNIESLKEKLSFIRYFVGITEKRKVVHKKMGVFLTYVQIVATLAACLSYWCWTDEMNETWAYRMVIKFSDLLQLTKPCTSDRVDMYFDLMKTSMADVVYSFVNFLQENPAASFQDQIASIREGLAYLIKFLMELPDQCTEDLLQISEDIRALAKAAGSFTVNKVKDDEGEEMNTALSRLLQKIGLIKEKIVGSRLQSSKDSYMVPMKEKTIALHEGLEFQRTFSVHLPEEKEYGKSLLTPSETVASKIFLELQDIEVGLMLHNKGQAETLQEGLRFLRSFLMNPPKKYNEGGELIFTKSEAVANEAASLICSLREKVMKEDTVIELNLMISELLEKIVLLKVEIRQVFLQVPLSLHCNLPDGVVFISSLLGDMMELMSYKADSIASVKHHIGMLHAELESLKSFLVDTAEQHNDHVELKDLWTCIIDVAYEAEYIIDSFVFRGDPEWYFLLWFPFAMENIELIKSRIKEIYNVNMLDIGIHSVKTLSHLPSRAHNLEIGEVVIGLNEEASFLIELMISGSRRLDIMSVVGPPGLGKTTLAKKVYYSPEVAFHFHVQAWCSPSQEYQRRELFIDILNCIVEDTDSIHRLIDDDLAEVLYKHLKRKKYFIVIDDLWDTDVWDELKISFPDDHNGSRVLLTSRFRYVALQVNTIGEPYPLRLLSAEESWKLLQQKIFLGETCPQELLEVGKHISERCKGVPLVIILVAGLLSRIDKNNNNWKQVAKSSRSENYMDLLEDVFELNYRHLPDYLKACFIYFGAFPVNRGISVSKLFRLWIAEGFLLKTKSKIVEDIAYDYLADLIGRSLVTVAKRSSSGGIKACGVHDLVWDLCIKKAKEENFFQLIRGNELSNPLTYEQRRLCICIEGKHFSGSMPSTPGVRCLLCSVSLPRLPYDISFFLCNFKLLRVLDFESINVGNSFPIGLELLELLRYLAIRGVNSVPSCVANLWNLETFLLKGYRDTDALSNSFWKMTRLRHVHILPRVSFSLQENELEDSTVLDNMLSFSTLVLSHGGEEIIRRFPNLRKLSCILIPSWDNTRKLYKFPTFDFPPNLESLKISAIGKIDYPFNIPFNLKKLTLSKFRLPWSQMSTFGKLPNLEVLKVLFRAFEGEEWEVGDGEFPKLKYLKLGSLIISQWRVDDYSFCCLEQLVLHRCEQLEEIPSSFGDIATLQKIEVQSCSRSAVLSARKILEEQEELGNEELKVIVDSRLY